MNFDNHRSMGVTGDATRDQGHNDPGSRGGGVVDTLSLLHGPDWAHRLTLAPLTTQQSNDDGTASPEDLEWYAKVAAGGHALTMTCAANIRRDGKAFPGQLGIYDERHLPGLARIAEIIRETGSVSAVQLHHGGFRSLGGAWGPPVGPSPVTGVARGLNLQEVEQVRDDFVRAALLAQRAGFEGVEIHGAFGWLVAQFISPLYNQRHDGYGGDLTGRSRFLVETLHEVRQATGTDFQIGLRLSMERHGMRLEELSTIAGHVMAEGLIDYLDLAPWDIEKIADDGPHAGRPLLDAFTSLPRHGVLVGASGHVMTGPAAAAALTRHHLDFLMLGRASILEPDFPRKILADPHHAGPELPVTQTYLRDIVGLSPAFRDYLSHYNGLTTN